jgi:hypothetical protein
MRKTIKLTLFTDVAGCIAMVITLLVKADIWVALFTGLYSFFYILVPTLIGTLIFLAIRQKTTLKAQFATSCLQFFLLSLLFLSGVYLWAVLDVMATNFSFNNLTFARINNDFKNEFAGFLPVVFCEALIIPILYNYLNKNQ